MKTYKKLKPTYEDFVKAYNKALLAKANIYKFRKEKLRMVYITLNLTGYWFNKIKNGEKTHEYRLASDYWKRRIKNLYDQAALYGELVGIVFKLGYPKKEETDKHLIALITKKPVIINGKNTDLKIDAPVFDIEFRLL